MASTTLVPTLRIAPRPKRMSVPTGREVEHRLVDVGRQHRDAHLAALGEVDRRLVLVVADAGEHRGHVLGGVVGLEIGRPVRHDAVGRGVRAVERVVGERQQDVPERLDRGGRVAVVLHALGETLVLLVEDLLLLLAHGATQQVGLAERVAGEHLGDRHDLFLVDDQAVGLAEDLLERLVQLRVDRRDLLAAVLAVGVVVVGVGAHRTGPVQRADGGDVVELGGGHAAQEVAHRPAVELEHPERLAAGQQLVGGLVVEPEVVEVERFGLPLSAMLFSASSMIVRLRRPRKSIFSRPRVSQTPMSNCVMMAPSASRRWIGMTSISGCLDMITPAACTPHCRLRPSRSWAVSTISLTCGSDS